jgi:hypothetical protein
MLAYPDKQGRKTPIMHFDFDCLDWVFSPDPHYLIMYEQLFSKKN